MPSAIVRGASGQPGPGAYPQGLTTGIFNDLNFVIPDYIPGLIAKYGNSSYMLAAEILGSTNIEQVNTSTNTYSHFEKGRPYGSGLVASNVAATGVGNNIVITLKSPQSYLAGPGNTIAPGTVSPFLVNQTVKLRSNGLKAQVVSINPATPGAFTMTLRPMGTYPLVTGPQTSTQINAGEGLETFGNQLAGQASDSQGTQQPNLYRYDNTATVLRASVKASDLAGMNKTQIDFGNGSFYLPTLAIKTKLVAEPGLSALAINVDTTDGLVTLSGKVDSYEQIAKAVKLALDTEGVHKVISTLQVSGVGGGK